MRDMPASQDSVIVHTDLDTANNFLPNCYKLLQCVQTDSEDGFSSLTDQHDGDFLMAVGGYNHYRKTEFVSLNASNPATGKDIVPIVRNN